MRVFSKTYVVNANGESLSAITDFHSNHSNHRWSPDGDWIVYVETRRNTNFGHLQLMRPDGSDLRERTPGSKMRGLTCHPDPSAGQRHPADLCGRSSMSGDHAESLESAFAELDSQKVLLDFDEKCINVSAGLAVLFDLLLPLRDQGTT